jgi:hypothetical protein
LSPTLSALIILLAIAIYGFIHSLLASLRLKDLARRAFGPGAQRVYRLAYNGFAVVSFLPVLALILMLPDQGIYPLPYTTPMLLPRPLRKENASSLASRQ